MAGRKLTQALENHARLQASPLSEELPPGYKMTELGLLPEEWQVVRLGEALEEVDERVGASTHPMAANLPILSLTKNEGLVLQSERFGKRIATEDVSNYKIVRMGQIVYNPYVIWEGAIHVLWRYEAGLVSPVYPVLAAKEKVADPYFLDLWLRLHLLLLHIIAILPALSIVGAQFERRTFSKYGLPSPLSPSSGLSPMFCGRCNRPRRRRSGSSPRSGN
jgi:hypothetical protein